MIGQRVGHYRVLEKIGVGGMGEVFRARDERLARDVALKFIRPASGDNPDHLRRFEQEARAAAALNHPNIVAIYDVGFHGTTPYIVSELLQGKTLRRRLAEGPLPLRQASDLALQVAQGLTAAHDRHIVHRDLKPENLFITEDDRIKILDFGVAKVQLPPDEDRGIQTLTTVTKSGAVVGTVAYMSPEQLRGKPVDHRSDVFSFGAILYEMLTGRRAFQGETEVDTMTAVLREEPPATNLDHAAVPPGYRDILKHCLEKEPEDRFQSAKDLAFALQTLGGSSGIRPGRYPARLRKSGALPWALVAIMAVAIVLLAATALLRAPIKQPVYQRLTFEAGTVYAARFSSDGQSVVYGAAWNGKPVQLFSTVGNSLLSQPLNLEKANLLAVSPSNELALVLDGTHNGQMETVNGTLARAPVAGGSPREVLPDVRWADWDAHGQLAVVHDVAGRSRLEYPIGNVLYQSGGWISNIRISPLGNQIAFMDHPALWDTRGVVSLVDFAGHVQTLSPESKFEDGLAWRPDGKEIWFTAIESGRDLSLMATDLSGKTRTVLDLPVGITLHDIAPDGRALVALDSRRLATAFMTLGDTRDVDLSWHDWNSVRDISPDAKSILFEDASEVAGPAYAVVVRKVDGTPPVRLSEGSAGSFSPDGKWAASTSTTQAAQINLLPIGPGQIRSINVTGLAHIHNGWARFLSDGQRLTVNGDETGRAARCYVVDLSSGKATPATPEGFSCGPSSPDARAVVGKGPNGSNAIYFLDGRAPQTIPSLDPRFNPLQWSNDGSLLYGSHAGEFPSNVYKVEIKTGKETLLQELKPGVPAGVVAVAPIVISRDGTHFAYSYNQTLSTLYVISGLR